MKWTRTTFFANNCVRLGLLFIFSCLVCLYSLAQTTTRADVLVIGGGAGGTAAGIQSARLGAKTIIVENTPWLGGMLSAAGVSAIDGNHHLSSGIWAEFRNRLYAVYGGPDSVATGWVSNTLFEPHVADSIFKAMAAKEKTLTVVYRRSFTSLVVKKGKIVAAKFRNESTGETFTVLPKVVIDATELGDVMKAAGVPYDLGMEADSSSGETVGVRKTTNVVQDLTYVATLKDYGDDSSHLLAKPAAYNPMEFDASCTDYYRDKNRKPPTVDARRLLDYGRLPRGKYMINWPIYGNDTYLNAVEMNEAQRKQEWEKAKQTTLRFVYFIQHELGFKNLGLADDEFPTPDRLALIPYHREGRRLRGLVRFTMRHIAEPFTYGNPLYRTGIAVGDYPIDHHHRKNPEAPQHLDFYPIPSYNIPLGALLPKAGGNLIVAEKGLSVSNVANGTTRLQPVVLLTGQAAGVLAAMSIRQGVQPAGVAVRAVQSQLLKAKAYLMPYVDVRSESPHFEAAQKIGATGILKGRGVSHNWANQTWFYPDSLVDARQLLHDLKDFDDKQAFHFTGDCLTMQDAVKIAFQLNEIYVTKRTKKVVTNPTEWVRLQWKEWGMKDFDQTRCITRLEFAVLLNHIADPFNRKAVTHQGYFVK